MRGWHVKCTECKTKFPSLVVAYFYFDRKGEFSLVGVCRFCMKGVTINHDADEIAADIREAHNDWAEEHGQQQIDLHMWEQELLEGDEE